MSFLLDTDICSAYLKGRHQVHGRFIQHGGRLHVSTVTVAELFSWVLRAKTSPDRLDGLLDLLDEFVVLDVTQDVARRFGEVRAGLLDRGRPTPNFDLLIGATALVHNLTLVTHNVQDFADIPNLTVADWQAP